MFHRMFYAYSLISIITLIKVKKMSLLHALTSFIFIFKLLFVYYYVLYLIVMTKSQINRQQYQPLILGNKYFVIKNVVFVQAYVPSHDHPKP